MKIYHCEDSLEGIFTAIYNTYEETFYYVFAISGNDSFPDSTAKVSTDRG